VVELVLGWDGINPEKPGVAESKLVTSVNHVVQKVWQTASNNFQSSSNRKKSETSDKMRPPKRNRKPPARGASAAKAPRTSKLVYRLITINQINRSSNFERK
jgi:hypothetical protein